MQVKVLGLLFLVVALSEVIVWNGGPPWVCRTAFRKARARAKLDAKINTYSFRHGLSKYARSIKCAPLQLSARPQDARND
jgi:hypothetical protein